jgi:hypothetical protein
LRDKPIDFAMWFLAILISERPSSKDPGIGPKGYRIAIPPTINVVKENSVTRDDPLRLGDAPKSHSGATAIPDDSDSIPDGHFSESSRDNLITMTVVVGLGSFTVIVLAILCCSKRAFIGKTVSSARDQALNENLYDRSHTLSESLESIRTYTQSNMVV